MTFLASFVHELWLIFAESGLWLVLGLLLAGVAHVLIPSGWIERQIGGRGLWPIAKASLMGVPLPLCSCSVIPVAAGLRRQGAGPGPTAAFTVSTPQTGEESIPVTWALLGPAFALARPVIGVVTALLTGLTVSAFGRRDSRPTHGEPETEGRPAGHPGESCHADHAHATHPPRSEASPAPACDHCGDGRDAASPSRQTGTRGVLQASDRVVRYGFGTLLDDLSHWLALGLALSALVAALVEPGSLSGPLGGGIGGMLLALVVGVPIYICSTSSTPLVAALIAAGVSPGAGMVLLLAGPASNLATITWLYRDLGARSTIAYLLSIAAVALAAGWLVNAFIGGITARAANTMHDHEPGLLGTIGGAALAALLAASLGKRAWRWIRQTSEQRPRSDAGPSSETSRI